MSMAPETKAERYEREAMTDDELAAIEARAAAATPGPWRPGPRTGDVGGGFVYRGDERSGRQVARTMSVLRGHADAAFIAAARTAVPALIAEVRRQRDLLQRVKEGEWELQRVLGAYEVETSLTAADRVVAERDRLRSQLATATARAESAEEIVNAIPCGELCPFCDGGAHGGPRW